MPCFFFYIYLFYKFKHGFKEEVVNSFKSQMKYIIIINTVYLYYIVMSNIIRFEVRAVFVIRVFFVVFFYNIEVNSYNREFFVFFLNVRCVYIFVLKFFNLFISISFDFSSFSIFEMFKWLKMFPKS